MTYSQDQMNTAAQIAQFVVENGRVESDGRGNLNLESLRAEVEFECGERGLPDCTEIAAAAVELVN
jgi:hypothetical protein